MVTNGGLGGIHFALAHGLPLMIAGDSEDQSETTARVEWAAMVAVRTRGLRVLRVDGQLEALRMLVDRREAVTRRRVQTVDRLQALLGELLPGQTKKDISTGQAKRLLAMVRPRDVAGKTRRRDRLPRNWPSWSRSR
jgi:hypothetical protein